MTFGRVPLAALTAAFLVLAGSVVADARSSGGYSRSGGSGRTPSFGGGGYGGSSSYRTPSTRRSSGGYSRPSSNFDRPRYAPPASAGDRSFLQERSGAAFDNYRRQQDAPRQPQYAPRQQQYPSQVQQPYSRRPSTQPPYAPNGGGYTGNRGGWYGGQGWAPPFNVGNRSFGVWDGLFLGALLSNLSRPGAGDWFHNNQNDPGYQEWRREAERQAETNADLKRKLDELDRQLKARDGQPRTPGALPPDVPPEVAEAQPTRTPDTAGSDNNGGGVGFLLPVLAIGVGGVGFLAWRRASRPGSSAAGPSSSPIATAGNILRHRASGETYTPSKFRVGMTLALDPTPFILAGPAIKLRQPEGSGGGQVSVEAVGRVVSGGTELIRLYLPDGRSLVQLHLDAAGDPDECRLFGTIDEITPADADEWGAWLDADEGMIGWPDFQTKDGKTYDRVWAPGEGRVAPRKLTETIQDLSGTRSVESQTMLYAAAAGVAEPGPVTEYLMVSALQDGPRAFVEVRSGIDINPVTLQLA